MIEIWEKLRTGALRASTGPPRICRSKELTAIHYTSLALSTRNTSRKIIPLRKKVIIASNVSLLRASRTCVLCRCVCSGDGFSAVPEAAGCFTSRPSPWVTHPWKSRQISFSTGGHHHSSTVFLFPCLGPLHLTIFTMILWSLFIHCSALKVCSR